MDYGYGLTYFKRNFAIIDYELWIMDYCMNYGYELWIMIYFSLWDMQWTMETSVCRLKHKFSSKWI